MNKSEMSNLFLHKRFLILPRIHVTGIHAQTARTIALNFSSTRCRLDSENNSLNLHNHIILPLQTPKAWQNSRSHQTGMQKGKPRDAMSDSNYNCRWRQVEVGRIVVFSAPSQWVGRFVTSAIGLMEYMANNGLESPQLSRSSTTREYVEKDTKFGNTI
jgi:hypothetical protein